METRSRKRAEASSSSAPSASSDGSDTRAAKRRHISTTGNTTEPPISPVSSRLRAVTRSSSMEQKPEPSSTSSTRRKKLSINQISDNKADNNSSDKGKAKEPGISIRDSSLGLNTDDSHGSGEEEEHGDDYERRIETMRQKLTSSGAFQEFVRKFGTSGFDDFLTSSLMGSISSSSHQIDVKKILSELRSDREEGKQLEALTQLCNMLSMATEGSLSNFSVDSFVPVLVGLLSNSTNPDIMLFAARALTHLVEALPSAIDAVVRYGAVSCFVTRLLNIEYMDLAEQSLQALKKISQERPTDCLRAGALMAVLSFLDFFSTGVQRVALSAAANMCKKLSSDAVDFVMQAVPSLTNLLQHHDEKVLEHAIICLTHIAESFSSSPEKLDELCNHGLVTQSAALISPTNSGGGQASLSASTYTGLIRLLSTCASGSPLGAKSLLLLGISRILKDILSGSNIMSTMSVSPALSRPPDQIFEIVNLANELLPPLPRGTISLPPSSSLIIKDSNGNMQNVLTRGKLLNDQPKILQQYGMDLLPVIIEIYGSSVNNPIRLKCLSVIKKLMYFSTTEMIKSLINAANISSFLAGVLGSEDPQVLVLALQIAEILMKKLPGTFSNMFVKEGVVHAVDVLARSDAIQGSSSRSSRNRRQVDNKISISNSVPSVNSTHHTSIVAYANTYKEKYFPSDPNGGEIGITQELHYLNNLCQTLNRENKLKGKSKPGCSPIKEARLADLVSVIIHELSRVDKVSTFEFIHSDVVASLLDYFTCGLFSEKGKNSLPKIREQAINRYKSFISTSLACAGEKNTVPPMSVLVEKLQNALSSLERFHVVLRGNTGVSASSQPIKLRLCRSRGEKDLREFGSKVVMIDPSASLAAVESFLWPRIQQTESGTKPDGNSAARGTERNLMRSRPSVHIGDKTKKETSQEKITGSLKAKGKAVLKSTREEGSGPVTRNVTQRRGVLGKNSAQSKVSHGDSTSKVDESDVSALKIDESIMIEDDDISNDDEEDIDDILRTIVKPDVHDVKLNESAEEGPVPTSRGTSSTKRLVFTANGRLLDHRLTIYEAIHISDGNNSSTVAKTDLSSIYNITYQRAESQPDKSSLDDSCHNISLLDSILRGRLPCNLQKSDPTYNILALLRILEGLNQMAPRLRAEAVIDAFSEGKILTLDELRDSFGSIRLPSEDFMNTKLTPKLARQIQDSLGGSLPAWCDHLTKSCPFLFPFETRREYLYLTAFGDSRVSARLQQQQQGIEGNRSVNERDAGVGKLMRQKVRVSRNQILDSAAKVMEIFSSQRSVLEVEYFGEVGTGLGPTLEFYTLLSRDFQKEELGMWRANSFRDGDIGLFPRPWPLSIVNSNNIQFTKVLKYFRLLGQVVAKSLQDGRLLDLPLGPAFYKSVLGQELDLHDIVSFDAELGITLQEFRGLVCRKKYLESIGKFNQEELLFRGASVEELCLDFSLPGYPEYVLKLVGENVDMSNLGYYISLVVDATVGTGIMRQMEAFRSGFNQVFDISTLQIFSPNELDYLLCGRRELWKADTLADHIKFDHGYTARSPVIVNFLEIMGEFSPDQQQAFCQFVTGAPRLPPGGLAVLNPKLTIVRKLSESADDNLPSVMTCANYLKLPPYSSKEILYKKLMYAISEGQESFDLS